MGLTGLLFTAAFLAGLVLALTRHPRYGLFTYLAAFYVHPPSRWWGAGLPDLRWSLLAAAVTVIAVWRRKEELNDMPKWYSTLPGKLLLAFTVWIWIQNIWALDHPMHMELSILFSKYLLLFYLVYTICSTPEEVEAFLLAHIAGCFYLGYLAFGSHSSGRLEGVGGPGINEANALGMQLATAVMCAAMFVLVDRRWKLWFCLAALAFILNGVVLSGSRGSFLSIIFGGLTLLWMKPRTHRKVFYSLSILAAALFLVVANQAFWSRIETIGAAVDDTKEMDTSALSRLVVAQAQVQMAMKYPLGTGHRGTEVLSTQYIDPKYLTIRPDGTPGARSSHNTFLSALVEQGIVGGVIFICMGFWCIAAARQLRRNAEAMSPTQLAYVAGIVGALTVILVAGVFVDYIKSEVQIWFFALLASMQAQFRRPARTAAAPPIPNTKVRHIRS